MPERIFDGEKLRAFRVVKRLSQADLAQGLGVKTNAVWNWENERAKPPQERLPAIAALVGVSLDELAPRPGPPNLADLRCDAGMKQSDTTPFTQSSSPNPIRAAESGKRTLSDRAVDALADAYNVTRAELLAAQRRSFGHEVPATEPVRKAAAGSTRETTMVGKFKRLQDDVYQGALPSDADIAELGNRKSGRPVLAEGKVRDLRTGELQEATEDELDALALAFDLPPVYFRSHDAEIDHLVISARAVRSQYTIMAARGGDDEIAQEAKDQLRNFISDTWAEILGPDGDSLLK
jgi:transcriptional regulator with XRE-family HTH domain